MFGTIAYALVATLVLGLLFRWVCRCRVSAAAGWPLGLAFCWGVELWQLSGVPAHLSARWIGWRLSLGTTFDWRDVALYPVGVAIGAGLLVAADGWLSRRRTARPEGTTAASRARTARVPLLAHVVLSAAVVPYLLVAGHWLIAPWPALAAVVGAGAVLHLLVLTALIPVRPRRQAWAASIMLVILQAVAAPLVFLLIVAFGGLLLSPFTRAQRELGGDTDTAFLIAAALSAVSLAAIAWVAGSRLLPRRASQGAAVGGLVRAVPPVALLAVLCWGLVIAPVPDGAASGPYDDPYAASPQPGSTPSPGTGNGPSLAPTPTTPTTPAPVKASRPCSGGDLELAAGGWDRATGNGFGTLTATNRSASACWLRGRPLLTMRQPGVEIGTGAPDPVFSLPEKKGKVALAPGGSATAQLAWRGYGSADHAGDVSQTLLVRITDHGPAATARLTPLPHDAGHPFDLIDGGYLGVTTWQEPTAQPAP